MPNKISPEKTLQLINEANRRRAENDVAFFIETYGHVEDKDGEELVVPFKLWSGQKQALNTMCTEKRIIALKARQLGITWLALHYAAHGMLYHEGYSVLALSDGEDTAKELVRRIAFIFRYMPKWFIKRRGETGESIFEYDNTATICTVFRRDGESSTFQSFPASQDAGSSFTGNLALIDEWAKQQWARDIWNALYPTINRPTGGQLIGISTIKRGTFFEELWSKSKEGLNNLARIFLPWSADPRRDATWYEQTKMDMGEAIYQEYPASEEEAFKIPGGSFFSEVRDYIHIKRPDYIPEYAQRFVSLDYGLDMCAAYWYWVDNQGNARIYRELHEPNLLVSDAAEKIKELQGEEHITAYLAPPDLIHGRHRETGKTTADVFAEHGIYLTETSNNRVTGWQCVKELLKPIEVMDEQTGEKHLTAKLTIDEGCAPNLWRCLLNVQHNKNKYNDIEGKGESHKLTHAPDSVRCFAIYWIEPSGEPKEERRAKWAEDMYEDYYNCKTDEDRNHLIGIWGNPFI